MFMNIISPYFQKSNAMKPRFEAPKKREDIFYSQRGASVPDNKKSVSFTSLQSTLDYIANYKFKYPEMRLQDLDSDKINNICEGIPVFKGLTAKGLQLITNYFESIRLQTGCIHQCSHCGANAENKLTTMLWDNFTALSDGIKTLKERLGYNPFDLTSINHSIYFFIDSDPIMYKSKGKDGILRNIFDAAKYYYEKTGTRTNITTAGWPLGNKTSQKAAESFVENSECLDNFQISVHPFHDYMQKSIKSIENGSYKEARNWRNKYIDMMANVIKTTIKLKDKKKNYKIILEADEQSYKPMVRPENAEYLLSEIFNKLEAQGIDMSYFIKRNYFGVKEYQNVSRRSIGHIGRGADYASPLPSELGFNNIMDIKKSARSIAPDGRILIRPFYNQGQVGNISKELPFKLNFPLPTKDNSKRPPLPKLEIID